MAEKQSFKERLKELKLSHVLTMVIFTIIFFGAIYGIIEYQRNNKNNVEPKIEVLFPIDGDVVATDTINVEGQAESYDEVLINGNVADVSNDGKFNEEILLHEGENEIKIIAVKGTKKTERVIVVNKVATISPVIDNVSVPTNNAQENVITPTTLSTSGPETLWIPEITALSLASVGWYESKKKLKKSQHK